MSAMASQITGISIVCSTVCSSLGQRKHQSSASLVTGGFPSQRASNTENVSIWRCHHGWQSTLTSCRKCTLNFSMAGQSLVPSVMISGMSCLRASLIWVLLTLDTRSIESIISHSWRSESERDLEVICICVCHSLARSLTHSLSLTCPPTLHPNHPRTHSRPWWVNDNIVAEWHLPSSL